ncbi:MAG: hypothetical protein K6U80_13750 [Firmicutes bacterium]|nr:hypothetical protein [Bacillota bacterium]
MVKLWRFGLTVMLSGIILSAGVLAGEGNVSIPVGTVLDYFPMQTGNQWAYEITSNGANILIEYRVIDRFETDGQTTAILESKANGATRQTETYRVKPEGIFTILRQAGNYQFAFTPHQCLLKYPVQVGGRWEQTGTFSDKAQNLTFTYQLKCKYEALQNLKVPAGLFKVMKVALVMDNSDGSHVQGYRYFSPGVGLVKEDFYMTVNKTQRTTLVSVLKSYQIKNWSKVEKSKVEGQRF